MLDSEGSNPFRGTEVREMRRKMSALGVILIVFTGLSFSCLAPPPEDLTALDCLRQGEPHPGQNILGCHCTATCACGQVETTVLTTSREQAEFCWVSYWQGHADIREASCEAWCPLLIEDPVYVDGGRI